METNETNPETLLTPEVEATILKAVGEADEFLRELHSSASQVSFLPDESWRLETRVNTLAEGVAALKKEMAEHTKEVNERLDRLENRLEILAGMLVLFGLNPED